METASWVLAGVITGGILHIFCILGVPYLAENNAWARLDGALPANELTVVDASSANALPFSSPSVVYAYCPFDISERNLTVSAPLPDATWSIAVSTRFGENFYLATGADTKRPDIRILVIPRNRLPEETSTEKSEDGDEQNIIVSNADNGVVVIRAPLRGESFRASTLEWLQEARCELQKPLETAPLVAAAPAAVVRKPAITGKTPNIAKRYRGRRRDR